MKDKRFMTGVKKIVGNSARIELMRGTIAQNDKHVEKEGDFYEVGSLLEALLLQLLHLEETL